QRAALLRHVRPEAAAPPVRLLPRRSPPAPVVPLPFVGSLDPIMRSHRLLHLAPDTSSLQCGADTCVCSVPHSCGTCGRRPLLPPSDYSRGEALRPPLSPCHLSARSTRSCDRTVCSIWPRTLRHSNVARTLVSAACRTPAARAAGGRCSPRPTTPEAKPSGPRCPLAICRLARPDHAIAPSPPFGPGHFVTPMWRGHLCLQRAALLRHVRPEAAAPPVRLLPRRSPPAPVVPLPFVGSLDPIMRSHRLLHLAPDTSSLQCGADTCVCSVPHSCGTCG